MNAFISYSHQDQEYLDMLLKHLAQIKRAGLLDAWTDHEIEAGKSLNAEIAMALDQSRVFFALLSPDYINSNYCYENEFKKAQELSKAGKLKIVPIIVEPCDWHNTPFGEIKALPKDGKPVADWSNPNTAFLNVITEVRKFLSKSDQQSDFIKPQGITHSHNKYRAQKDFDSIEKMDCVKEAFTEVYSKIKEYLKEVVEVEGIKAKILEESESTFRAILVNKNKIGVETVLTISTSNRNEQTRNMMMLTPASNYLNFEISGSKKGHSPRIFELDYDDFHLYWKEGGFNQRNNDTELEVNKIVDLIWEDWLHSVGIEF